MFLDFQMRYTVVKDDNMEADYRDIRFYDATANIELPYWIESYDATSAKVLIKTGSSQVIQMYYGNNQASAVSNPLQVLDFYDDFTGTTLDTGKWTKIDPSGVVSQNDELILAGGASWATGINSVPNFSRPYVFEASAATDTGSINYSTFGLKKLLLASLSTTSSTTSTSIIMMISVFMKVAARGLIPARHYQKEITNFSGLKPCLLGPNSITGVPSIPRQNIMTAATIHSRPSRSASATTVV